MLESHFGSRELTKTNDNNGIWDVCENTRSQSQKYLNKQEWDGLKL